MPFPIMAAIAAAQVGSSIYNQVAGNAANRKANRESMAFQERMYGVQRADALADWDRQNQYDSPAAQMARLKAAGLNPNMVYGSGADAQSAGPVRSSSPGSYNAKAFQPALDLSSLGSIYDMRLKETANDLQQQDVIKKAAETQNLLTDNRTKEFDLKMKEDLKMINKNMAAQALNKLTADVGNASNQFQRDTETMGAQVATIKSNAEAAKSEAEKALNEAQASKHLEKRVLQEIDNLKSDGDVKKFQSNMAKLGIVPSDSVYLRIMATLFGPERIRGAYDKFGKLLNKL